MSLPAGPEPPRPIGGPIREWELPPPEIVDGASAPAAVRCLGPDGRAVEVAAFDDGDRWRARLAADAPGAWRWTAGGAEGEFTAGPPAAGRPLAARRVAAQRRPPLRCVAADGAPFFFLADTAWAIVWKGTPDQWARYLDRRAEQGFTVLQVNLLPWRWAVCATSRATARSWTATRITPEPGLLRAASTPSWRMAAERGLYTCLMLIWGGPRPDLPAGALLAEQAVRFARYAVARFGAFPMLWSLSGDADVRPGAGQVGGGRRGGRGGRPVRPPDDQPPAADA